MGAAMVKCNKELAPIRRGLATEIAAAQKDRDSEKEKAADDNLSRYSCFVGYFCRKLPCLRSRSNIG
jgi:hypothetical protein